MTLLDSFEEEKDLKKWKTDGYAIWGLCLDGGEQKK
jgi:hypothetical protein